MTTHVPVATRTTKVPDLPTLTLTDGRESTLGVRVIVPLTGTRASDIGGLKRKWPTTTPVGADEAAPAPGISVAHVSTTATTSANVAPS